MCVGCVEEISGIASQSSCSEWETRRNRYTGQVFQVFEEGWAVLGGGVGLHFLLRRKTITLAERENVRHPSTQKNTGVRGLEIQDNPPPRSQSQPES